MKTAGPFLSEIVSGSKLGIDATKKIPGEGFKRPWPPLIKMDAAVRMKSISVRKCHLIWVASHVEYGWPYYEDDH